MHLVDFISLEEDEKDLIVSFAISDGEGDIRSLILLRTPVYEEFLDESERGVHLSFEGQANEGEEPNILQEVIRGNDTIELKSKASSFKLNLSKISAADVQEAMDLIEKQNHDNRFSIKTA